MDIIKAMLKAAKIAVKHNEATNEFNKLFEERYGHSYSELDCDPVIDAIDYGTARPYKTIEALDAAVLSYCNIEPVDNKN